MKDKKLPNSEAVESACSPGVPLAVVVAYRFARMAVTVLLLLLILGLSLEAVLRVAGIKPMQQAQAGETATVPDNWMGWRLRPNVLTGQDWVLTNSLSMHERRKVTIDKPQGTFRGVVVGSSLVYGLGLNLKDTIPASAERELVNRGARAQVLNFGVHGFTLTNVSALIQNYVHQLDPDVIVLVVDLNMVEARWASLREAAGSDQPIKKLSWTEGLLVRAGRRSVVISWLEEPSAVADWLAAHLPFPLPQPVRSASAQTSSEGAKPAEKRTQLIADDTASRKSSVAAYQERERREVRSILAAIAAFCREMHTPLLFVTPYGPYFHYSDRDQARYSNLAILDEWERIYGSRQKGLEEETLLLTGTIRDIASEFGDPVLDMLSETEAATFADPKFGDSIHLSAEGCNYLGKLIGDTIFTQFLPHSKGRAASAAL